MNLSEIRRRCAEKGLTFASLEREAGIGNGMVAKWENGFPRADSLQKVAKALECTVDDLLRGDEE